METLRELAPLFNLLLLPAVIGIYRIGRALQVLESFMEQSIVDRAAIHAKLDPIERALLSRGIISPN